MKAIHKLRKMKLFIIVTLILFHFLNCAFENKKETLEPSKPETTQNESEVNKNPLKGFNDTVILKNGTVLNGVEATPTKESLVVTNAEGEAYAYNKKEVKEVKKGKVSNSTDTTESEAKPIPSNFSAYQGNMPWEDAKKKCASIKMRLPTRAELKTAYETKVTESWKANAKYYWAEEFSSERAYLFGIYYGVGVDFPKDEDFGHVRCIR